jgi:hypothetical protein
VWPCSSSATHFADLNTLDQSFTPRRSPFLHTHSNPAASIIRELMDLERVADRCCYVPSCCCHPSKPWASSAAAAPPHFQRHKHFKGAPHRPKYTIRGFPVFLAKVCYATETLRLFFQRTLLTCIPHMNSSYPHSWHPGLQARKHPRTPSCTPSILNRTNPSFELVIAL